MLDLVLAILHHLLILSLAGLMMAGFVLVRPGLGGAALKTLGGIDASYGGTAVLILIVGFGRVFLGAKGADFYLHNPVFWAKIGAFAAVGLLSIQPTIAILKWRRRAAADPAFVPPEAEVARVHKVMLAELAVFALIPIFAAAMARGYGL